MPVFLLVCTTLSLLVWVCNSCNTLNSCVSQSKYDLSVVEIHDHHWHNIQEDCLIKIVEF